MYRLISVISLYSLLSFSILYADFDTGKRVFEKKCASCHGPYISAKVLKDNFYNKNNKLLKMKIPTVNMLSFFLKDDSNHIGDKTDPEMQKFEINEFVKDYLYKPNRENSVISNSFLKYFDKKKSMRGEVSEEEISNIVDYLFEYRDRRAKNRKKITLKNMNIDSILKLAQKENKLIIIEAMSKTCHYCKKMEKDVLSKSDIRSVIDKDFIFLKVDVDDTELPLGLMKHYKKITPSFFIVDKNGKLKNSYPGSWNKKDFKEIMKENL